MIRRLKLLVIILLFFLSISLGLLAAVTSRGISLLEIALSVIPGQRIPNTTNVLVLGSDNTMGVHRSDTIMVLHIDPHIPRIFVLSIPRDTLVVIPGTGYDKINHAFAYGGPELSQKTAAAFLGVEIPYYVHIQVKRLERVIDRMGGITIDVEKRLFYTDLAGGLRVDLQPGVQQLNGEQALGYLRFRMDREGDFGRIKRQQNFLTALATELLKPQNLPRFPLILGDFLSAVDTNIPSTEIGGFVSVLRTAYQAHNVQMTLLPGTSTRVNNVYYLQPDKMELQKILQEMQHGG